MPLLDLFHEVTYQTSLGQYLDLTTADPSKARTAAATALRPPPPPPALQQHQQYHRHRPPPPPPPPSAQVDFSRFSMNVYSNIVIYKARDAPHAAPSASRRPHLCAHPRLHTSVRTLGSTPLCPPSARAVGQTAFYTFYLPIALGMRLAGIDDAELYRKARDICVAMGTRSSLEP